MGSRPREMAACPMSLEASCRFVLEPDDSKWPISSLLLNRTFVKQTMFWIKHCYRNDNYEKVTLKMALSKFAFLAGKS